MRIITLLTGSTLGNTEYVAEHVANQLSNRGFSFNLIHGPQLEELPLKGIWLVMTSTHGAGDLPDNIQPLYDRLIEQNTDLSQVLFGAIGLGSSEYDTFCGGIKKLSQLLLDHGAQKVGDQLEIDVMQFDLPEEAIEGWIETWLEKLPDCV